MRVNDSNSGSSGFNNKENRSDRFRKGRVLHQQVTGTLLSWVSEDIAWVEIDGMRLLAQIKSKPQVSAKLTFRIEQLTPKIILKEYGQSQYSGGGIQLLSTFETARSSFEAAFRPYTDRLAKTPHNARLSSFSGILSIDSKLLVLYWKAIQLLAPIQQRGPDLGYLRYTPWKIPTAHRVLSRFQPTVAPSASSLPFEIEFDLSPIGLAKIEIVEVQPILFYKVLIQHRSHETIIKEYLTQKNSFTLHKTECIGIRPFPNAIRGGMLTEYFRQDTHR